jgi:hypothetical protein
MDHIREGKHGARSTKQAIAIGLSKARRAGVKLAPPKRGDASEKTTRSARGPRIAKVSTARTKVSAKRSRATRKALKREGHSAASPECARAAGAFFCAPSWSGAIARPSEEGGAHKGLGRTLGRCKKAARTRARNAYEDPPIAF